MNYLGIDLGGTNVAAAVVDDAGTILGRASLPTPRGVEPVADAMPPRPTRRRWTRGSAGRRSPRWAWALPAPSSPLRG